MKPLRDVLKSYAQEGRALAHFNFSDSNQLKAIAEASKETNIPIIAGLSEGEREYFPISHARTLVDEYRKEGVEIYLNADHTYGTDKVKAAIDVGVDSVVVDGAKLGFDENVALVKECVAIARASGRDVVIEGEVGFIGTSSKQLDEVPEGITMTTPEESKRFIDATGADCLAPAIGNLHGMLKNAPEPKLHPELVASVRDAIGLPLVLHGASGNTNEEVAACIQNGIALVHINTELRVLYHNSLRASLQNDETTPYKFLAPVVEEMKRYIVSKQLLFARK